MAVRNGAGAKKTPAKNTSNSAKGGQGSPQNKKLGKYWAILFWLVFVIVIYGLFWFNRETIVNSVQIIRNERMAQRMARENVPAPVPPPPAPQAAPLAPPPAAPAPARPAVPPAPPPVVQPVTPPPAVAAPAVQPATPAPAAAAQTVAPPAAEPPLQAALPHAPVELRERTLYFIQIDRSGMVFRSRVSRRLPVSATPMTDTLNALIAGPSENEQRRGLITLIPPGTTILSATVIGQTAHISFSEDFRYNTYGVEGYIGQLRQVIYTVTEFPNVNDVQILIDGRRVDFLGEGIRVSNPIRRGTF